MAIGGKRRQQIEDALAPALRLARGLPPWNASHVLLQIARVVARRGHSASAAALIEEACDRHDAPERNRRSRGQPDLDFLSDAAEAFANAGRSDRAIRLALTLPRRDGARDNALARIATVLGWAGDASAMRRVLAHMTSPLYRFDLLWSLANAHARAGRATKAHAVIASIQGSSLAAGHRRAALTTVAEWLAFRGNAPAALAAARAIRSPEHRALLFVSMAEWAAAEQPLLAPDLAISLSRRARRAPEIYLKAAEIEARRLHIAARQRVLARLASAAARSGNLAIAGAVARQLTGIVGVERLAEIRAEIAAAEARAGRVEAATKLARRLPQRWRAVALGAIAVSEAKAGDQLAAMATAAKIALPERRVGAMLAIARTAAAQGRTADARKQLRHLGEVATAERADIPCEVIEAIACEQARVGDASGAAVTLSARKDDPQAPSFASAALALAEAGRYRAALLFAQHARSIDDRAVLIAEIELIRRA